MVVKANPDKGFNFPYLLKTSKKTLDAKYLIVESNNTGNEPTTKAMIIAGKRSLNHVCGNIIAKKLNYPLLMPVIPFASVDMEEDLKETLPNSWDKWKYYFTQLDSDSLKIDNDKYKRVDLQLIAMIDDAREKLLKENNQSINDKVIMIGYASSSIFAARFTFLRPERVAVAVGGSIGGLLPIPKEEINGIKLMYPIGSYDFENITGKKFNLEEYKKTPQFYWQGKKDKSNSFNGFVVGRDTEGEDLTDEEYEVVKKLFVNGLSFDKKKVPLKVNTVIWENSQKYINQTVDNVKFESPKKLTHTEGGPGIGPKINKKIRNRSVEFIKENLN
jgi:hypothetical protein